MVPALIARVLVDSPLPQLDRLFDYAVPERLRESAVPGVRVRVPLRSAGRIADGFIVELVDSADFPGVLSELDEVLSPIPVLAPEVWALARRAADRAAGSAIDIVRLAVPHRQVRVEKAFLAAVESEPIPVVDRPEIDGYPATLGESLAAGSRIALDAIPLVTELPGGGWVGSWALSFAQAAARAVASGRSAILCVPDYRDQDQVEAALATLLPPDRIVRLDARQSNPDRYRAFLKCLGDAPLAIVGNRSVVYAPARDLGLLALWDDGDPLHSEPLAPYVHSRDAALLRQEQQGCALLIAGHSRSTEVERLVEVGWFTSVSPSPGIRPRIVPTAQQVGGDRLAEQARIPSSAWREARAALETGPVLIQVARPGYAPRLACADCGQTARCLRCEGPLTKRSASSTPACSWCGALAVGWRCSHCEGERLKSVGAAGATRTAEDLGRAFPGVRVVIADGERQVQHVDARPALVIATRGAEPIAAGGYRAVLLLDGEQMVARESLRVAEDCLRWWSNAVALAAPGAPSILVGVGGALASALVTWRHAAFAAAELADRRRLRFPPAVRVATLTGAVEAVSRAVSESGIDAADVLGPVDVGPAAVRTILRFDYAAGAEMASTLRSEVIRAATNRRRPTVGAGPRRAPAPTLKVRFDDVEPFLEQ
ncbi:primosomal protein N' [Antiquaquibacter soli]|uniref:Probable replication restart protein PriA n=1 Tax=Antiquaquibacter soli TaxID=3064523 RepID=A0ABT9BRM9_9MICO|nr:primosomal protein N' [Protaetiibacter sp. WY-16]MDO7882010.1 primosomal protein N' [Protaetiibacter sp. WY-16]